MVCIPRNKSDMIHLSTVSILYKIHELIIVPYTSVKPYIKGIYRLINLISDCHTVVRTISGYLLGPRMISRYHPRKKP